MFAELAVVVVFILIAGLCGVLWARSARKKAWAGLLKAEASDAGVTTYLCPACGSKVLRSEWSFRSMTCLGCAQQNKTCLTARGTPSSAMSAETFDDQLAFIPVQVNET